MESPDSGVSKTIVVSAISIISSSVCPTPRFYLSTDSGDSFRVITKGAQALAALFDLDGEHLWLSSYAGTPALARANLTTGAKNAVTLPPLTRDAVANIAQNPMSRNEYAIATFERNVYVTQDSGGTWRQIARDGKGL